MRSRKLGSVLFSLAAASWLVAAQTGAAPPKVEGPAEDWVIVEDIPPFVLVSAGAASGHGGVTRHFFGKHPDNGRAGADYQDTTRHMLVEVSVDRDVRTTYLDFVIEAPYREDKTGRFYEPDTSLITLFGQPVLSYCNGPPSCPGRIYTWRSGENLVLTINAGTAGEGRTPGVPLGRAPIRPPCPEPTEILQAYLERYPSWLTQSWGEPTWTWANSGERTREHVHTEVAIELAATQYWLGMAGTQPAKQPDPNALQDIDFHLFDFAKKRERLLGGPPARAEEERLRIIRHLPLAERLPKLTEVAEEYKKWWTDNIGAPIQVPNLPPEPVPAPSTPPATTPSAAPPTTPSAPVTP